MKLLSELMSEEDSEASKQAKQLGLTSKGWGRWADKSGNVTHNTDNGKLVPVDSSQGDLPLDTPAGSTANPDATSGTPQRPETGAPTERPDREKQFGKKQQAKKHVKQILAIAKTHDWDFEYSDDHSAWRKGHQQLKDLTSAIALSGARPEEVKGMLDKVGAGNRYDAGLAKQVKMRRAELRKKGVDIPDGIAPPPHTKSFDGGRGTQTTGIPGSGPGQQAYDDDVFNKGSATGQNPRGTGDGATRGEQPPMSKQNPNLPPRTPPAARGSGEAGEEPDWDAQAALARGQDAMEKGLDPEAGERPASGDQDNKADDEFGGTYIDPVDDRKNVQIPQPDGSYKVSNRNGDWRQFPDYDQARHFATKSGSYPTVPGAAHDRGKSAARPAKNPPNTKGPHPLSIKKTKPGQGPSPQGPAYTGPTHPPTDPKLVAQWKAQADMAKRATAKSRAEKAKRRAGKQPYGKLGISGMAGPPIGPNKLEPPEETNRDRGGRSPRKK
jgi:hypothetical protein